MPEPLRQDEEVVEELLRLLRDDNPEPPEALPDRTIRKVQALMTTKDLIDLTTVVFLLRFCAPFLELIAAAFGANLNPPERRPEDE